MKLLIIYSFVILAGCGDATPPEPTKTDYQIKDSLNKSEQSILMDKYGVSNDWQRGKLFSYQMDSVLNNKTIAVYGTIKDIMRVNGELFLRIDAPAWGMCIVDAKIDTTFLENISQHEYRRLLSGIFIVESKMAKPIMNTIISGDGNIVGDPANDEVEVDIEQSWERGTYVRGTLIDFYIKVKSYE
ncbi:MAG: hypothetical protein ACT4OJ_12940 [Bacteroidota bacterium]